MSIGTRIKRFCGAMLICIGTMGFSQMSSAALLSLDLVASASPFGFFPLATLGVSTFAYPTDPDDGAWILNVPAFDFAGGTYNQVIWSVNGTLEVGTASAIAAPASNSDLPQPSAPNNLLAPFWTDLDLGVSGDGAEWYIAVLNAGATQYTVYEWNNVPLAVDPSTRFSAQIWVQNGSTAIGHSNIWFVYNRIDSTAVNMTVGVENGNGTIGAARYFNGTGIAPQVGTDLRVTASFGQPVPEPATLSLLGIGLAGLAATLRRKQKSRS